MNKINILKRFVIVAIFCIFTAGNCYAAEDKEVKSDLGDDTGEKENKVSVQVIVYIDDEEGE